MMSLPAWRSDETGKREGGGRREGGIEGVVIWSQTPVHFEDGVKLLDALSGAKSIKDFSIFFLISWKNQTFTVIKPRMGS